MTLPRNRPPTHTGQMLLEEFLRPLDLSQAEVARRLKMPLNRLNELIKGKRGITPDTGLRLSELFRVSPGFWMNLQAGWDRYTFLQPVQAPVLSRDALTAEGTSMATKRSAENK